MKIDFIRNLNKFEKFYIILFTSSILVGITYGLINQDYFKCCEDAIGVPEEGTSPIKIFTSNYLLSLTELITAGVSSLYYNFHTFSVTASYLESQNALYMIVIILLIGGFELVGSLLMALTGFSFVEQNILKIRSNLNYRTLFLYGTTLIFVGVL